MKKENGQESKNLIIVCNTVFPETPAKSKSQMLKRDQNQRSKSHARHERTNKKPMKPKPGKSTKIPKPIQQITKSNKTQRQNECVNERIVDISSAMFKARSRNLVNRRIKIQKISAV